MRNDLESLEIQVVLLWNIRKTKWEEAPVLEFKESRRGHGPKRFTR